METQPFWQEYFKNFRSDNPLAVKGAIFFVIMIFGLVMLISTQNDCCKKEHKEQSEQRFVPKGNKEKDFAEAK